MYVNLRYKPKKEDLIVSYYLEPNKVDIKTASEALAGESSIGTWDKVLTLNEKIIKSLKPNVFYIKKNNIKVAYPVDLFEKGNMPQTLSSIAGNIFGMKIVRNLRLNDIEFPKSLINSFKGPRLGINGVRKILKIKKRPLIGTIIKPKLGLNEEEHANTAYKSWIGGVDIVKDDENLSSMKFNNFEKRAVKTLKARDLAEKKTGEKKLYVINITAETKEMIRRAEFIKKNNGKCIMIDIITSGWSSLQTLRNENLGLIIHAHRSGHGMFTENKKHGMSMLTVAKIARLIGVDQIHIGAVFGKMKAELREVKHIGEEIEENFVRKNKHVLEQKWHNIKPVFAICSGGLHPGLLEQLVKVMGNNIICQAGAGVHAHPLGSEAGARAMRQAIELIADNKSVKDNFMKYKELNLAIKRWGISNTKYKY